MARQVYLQGGPKDGQYVTIGDDWTEVVFADVPTCLVGIEFTEPLLPTRRYSYRPQGRRTLQGIEVFECA